jgi:uroporphyrin-III C-methyltransferase/precorrin-2 dehydrogenase/sirohydrochlorin ferrochelatase
VVVIGGGAVALRRTKSLLAADARVRVIAPRVDDELAGLDVVLHRRPYHDGDLAGAWLAHAAADDPGVNAAVAAEAERHRIWCVRADDAGASAAWVPAVTRQGDVTIAVTAGGDPRRAQRLRAAVALELAGGSLPLRNQRRPRVGTVALVGGGPGDPGLITVRGRQLLGQADVVIVDKLAPRELLAELEPDVEVVEAGKAPHAHNLTQDQINAVLVDRALAGQHVVRLKGGDPFVFGRGGEEALACVRAGLPFTVVPGVTSAIAVPAYAGIPVTHRGVTQDFAVVSAHLDPSLPGAAVDWAALATGPGTLVLLMAVAHLDQVAAELIKRGRDASTPVAVISDGTTPRQQVLTSTLAHVAAEATGQGIRPPAVVVIGEVVRLRELLGPRAGPRPARSSASRPGVAVPARARRTGPPGMTPLPAAQGAQAGPGVAVPARRASCTGRPGSPDQPRPVRPDPPVPAPDDPRSGRAVTAASLLAIAHGSQDPAARRAVDALVGRVRRLAPRLGVRAAFLQHAEPSLADGLAAAEGDVVVVPLLLSTGYHVTVDITRAAAAAGARVAEPLGPDPMLGRALADRLADAGTAAGAPVVLAAAGSSDPKAVADVELQARLLADLLGVPVVAAFASAARPTVDEAIAALHIRTGRPVAVAAYLLSPGRFHDRLRQTAATWVTAPLAGHPAVAELVVDRYRAASD